LGIWPETVRIEKEKRRGKLFSKISLRYGVKLRRQEIEEIG